VIQSLPIAERKRERERERERENEKFKKETKLHLFNPQPLLVN
jgi:hypothetical protein